MPHPLCDPARLSASQHLHPQPGGAEGLCQEEFGVARGVIWWKPRRIFPNFFSSGIKAAATLLLLPFENKSVGFSFQLCRAKIIEKNFFNYYFLVLMSPQPPCFFFFFYPCRSLLLCKPPSSAGQGEGQLASGSAWDTRAQTGDTQAVIHAQTW